MEQKPLVVHCTYDEQGPELRDLILNTFRAFVKTELHIIAKPAGDTLS